MTPELTRCAMPGTDKSGRMEQTCIGCHCRKVPAKDGAPVMVGRIEPGGFCQDRFPRVFIWTPGWVAKP